jgi:hypothetical protein
MIVDQRSVRQRDQLEDVPRPVRLLVLLRWLAVHPTGDYAVLFGLVEEARVNEESIAGGHCERTVREPDGVCYGVGSKAVCTREESQACCSRGDRLSEREEEKGITDREMSSLRMGAQ